MAKESDHVMRVDVRIPMGIYSEIERIAIATNQPYTPKSKNTDNPKPVVTPVILKLIELGLEAVSEKGNQGLDFQLSGTNQINISDIEQKILNTLTQKLEAMVSDKLDAIVINKINETISSQFNQTQSHLDNMVTSEINEIIATKINQTQPNLDEMVMNKINEIIATQINQTESNLELTVASKVNQIISTQLNQTQSNLDEIVMNKINEIIATIKNNQEDESEIVELVSDIKPDRQSDKNFYQEIKEIFSLNENADNEDKETIEDTEIMNKEKSDISDNQNLEIKSYDSAVKEIKRLKKQRLGNTAIARAITGKFYTKAGKTNWSDTQVRRVLTQK